ncbi:MAG: 30S ribosomal protein S7 [Chloroflexota bacterium]|nr:30S ribosomal protein S7 [Chloroflexota bacterium]
MPRKYTPPKQEVQPDVRYNSMMVSHFINRIMMGGKKSVAQRIMYETLDRIAERTGKPPLEVLEKAVSNVRPALEVKPRRVGGSTYQIPVEVPYSRQASLAMRWLLDAARNRPGHSMAEKLAAELMDAANETGSAYRKKEEMHRMAQANRAFAHFRW